MSRDILTEPLRSSSGRRWCACPVTVRGYGGDTGEQSAGTRLEKRLAGTEVRLLNDRRVPGHGAARVDHIAVDPGGITVIDTRNLRGKARVEKSGGLFSERRAISRSAAGTAPSLSPPSRRRSSVCELRLT